MGFKAQEMFNVHSSNAKPKRIAMDDPKLVYIVGNDVPWV